MERSTKAPRGLCFSIPGTEASASLSGTTSELTKLLPYTLGWRDTVISCFFLQVTHARYRQAAFMSDERTLKMSVCAKRDSCCDCRFGRVYSQQCVPRPEPHSTYTNVLLQHKFLVSQSLLVSLTKQTNFEAEFLSWREKRWWWWAGVQDEELTV